ncbi:MAG: aspartate--tRNA(Asn) ligase [Candidatus Pacearchaeota archaeon]|nr:MAG: aspartate--tRNA(Asn) ligase [Candidatus Pacearchaeota archaeon]
MERIYISEIKENQKVLLKGWVHDIRELGKTKFFLLRDISGIVQCVLKEGVVKEKNKEEIKLEDVVSLKGTVKKANLTNKELTIKNLEVEVSDITILNKSEEIPIQINDKGAKTDLSRRLDFRYLDVRKPKISSIFKIQSTIINSFREFFYNKGFIEIQTPAIIATSTEGGTELFEVNYFGKKAYLAQSPQLYKQLMAISLEKVFSTGAVWRAEKHDTSRHINEIRQLDIEVAFSNDLDVMKYLESVVKFIMKRVIEKNKKELEILNIKLDIPKVKYLRYKEAITLLKKNNFKIEEGEDFSPEAERKLCEMFPNTIIFTYEWPIDLKPFYIWPKDKNKNVSAGFDALFNGLEISSGGQRIHIPEILEKQIKNKGLDPKNFKWYIDAFKYGAPEHSGWSIGLERFTQSILNLENIREATLFPRDSKRLTP